MLARRLIFITTVLSLCAASEAYDAGGHHYTQVILQNSCRTQLARFASQVKLDSLGDKVPQCDAVWAGYLRPGDGTIWQTGSPPRLL